MNIYVGNLSYQTTEDDLRTVFLNHGEVTTVAIITDRYSGRSRGFGFVEMAGDDEARSAIEAVDGTEVQGRQLRVNEAKPRGPSGGGGGGGGDGGDRGRW